jgi:hypothetical protein
MNNIITLKNIKTNLYFNLNLDTLITTKGHPSLKTLAKDDEYYSKITVSSIKDHHLKTLDNTTAETYLRTHHPELFI